MTEYDEKGCEEYLENNGRCDLDAGPLPGDSPPERYGKDDKP